MKRDLETIWRGHAQSQPNENGCIEWTGPKNQFGYGTITYTNADGTKTSTSSNRATWIVHNGPIADTLKVLHSCDNPLCVNIAHLFLGTQKHNMADMYTKGRENKRVRKPRNQWPARFEALKEKSVDKVAEEFNVGLRTAMRWKQRMNSAV
jgi:hypothetical protein